MVVKNAPLVLAVLCIIHNGKILLGHRSNEPLKGVWFAPGGRILKNEAYSDCLKRFARSELGLTGEDTKELDTWGYGTTSTTTVLLMKLLQRTV